MGKLADKVFEDREARDAARTEFDTHLSQVKQDLESRGIAGRIADKVSDDARDVFDDAMEVAAQSKGVIAGTIAALAIWFLRNPIIAWLEGMLSDGSETEGNVSDDGE